MRKDATEKAKIMLAFDHWLHDKSKYQSHMFKGRPAYLKFMHKFVGIHMKGNDLIEYISPIREISADDIKKAMKMANQGRLSWDGENLIYADKHLQAAESQMAVMVVMTMAIWNYWLRSVQLTDNDVRDFANEYFMPQLVKRMFSHGYNALLDVRSKCWDDQIGRDYLAVEAA